MRFGPGSLCLAAAMLEHLDILLFLGAIALLLAGYPVAFALGGTAIIFALIGLTTGAFDLSLLGAFPLRIFGTMTNTVLIAVPMFVFMGVLLEKSKVAEELLVGMEQLFHRLRGGLGVSVTLVGALLAASTGIVGATVVTMGLLSLPTMLKRGYSAEFATGIISAAGTLGQIIPPSIVLILLADVLSSAYQQAQLEMGIFSPETLSVGDLFAGALLPGIGLVALYLIYQLIALKLKPGIIDAPEAVDPAAAHDATVSLLKVLAPPLLLIIAVLGSILSGFAAPTEAAAVGAVGALLLASYRLSPATGRTMIMSAISLLGVFLLATLFDLRVGRSEVSTTDTAATIFAIFLCGILLWGVVVALRQCFREKILQASAQSTTQISAMVFTILIGASLFSLVFRGLGGDLTVEAVFEAMPGGAFGALVLVMLVMFILGFFLDFIEIVFVVVPLVAPVLLQMDIDPIWLGVMMAINLQTSFLTPPFGFALFYLRGVAPDSVRTLAIYKGAIPFVLIQLVALAVLAFWPNIATWLPHLIYR